MDPFARAIGDFYAAALGHIPWESALDGLLAETGFDGAALWTLRRLSALSGGRSIWHRLDPSGKDDYINHYVHIDPNVPLVARPDLHRIIYDHKVLPEEQIDRNEYYAWYQARSGMRYHIGGVTRSDLPFVASVTVHRTKAKGHATPAEVERFSLLFDHLERALELEFRLSLDRAIVASLATQDATGTAGCIFLDKNNRAVFVNQVASDIAARNDGFALRADGPAALAGTDTSRLRALIADCTAATTVNGAGGAMRLPRLESGGLESGGLESGGLETGGFETGTRRETGRDYLVTVSPLHTRRYGPLTDLGPAVRVLIVDPDQERAVDQSMLRQLYGLSPAEAALAARLADGETLQTVARARGITQGTARSYLEHIFHKTATNRQSGLVKLLLSLPKK
jgi:DNA-binding CsgD family transcriptional regulator